MKTNDHLVVKKYLNEHSLVESNLISFNDFIENRMQEIVNEISTGIESDEFESHAASYGVGYIYTPLIL